MVTKKSITERIRVTKHGKALRRATSLGHNRANKTARQMQRKKKSRGLQLPSSTIKKYF